MLAYLGHGTFAPLAIPGNTGFPFLPSLPPFRVPIPLAKRRLGEESKEMILTHVETHFLSLPVLPPHHPSRQDFTHIYMMLYNISYLSFPHSSPRAAFGAKKMHHLVVVLVLSGLFFLASATNLVLLCSLWHSNTY